MAEDPTLSMRAAAYRPNMFRYLGELRTIEVRNQTRGRGGGASCARRCHMPPVHSCKALCRGDAACGIGDGVVQPQVHCHARAASLAN